MSAVSPGGGAATGVSADRRRYPGMRSFEERDQPCFFGRSQSTEELLLRVLSVRLLLQFAPSGAGKTSLLHAGLFPRLRPHGYLPFAIRLNQSGETVTEATARSLREAAERSGLHEPVLPAHAESLWGLLSGTQLWTPELLLLTPVLVFDQFEEVFTLRDEAFRSQFAREIGELCRGRQALGAAEPAGEAPPELKIIISLREEYLGALEEMSAAIPDLFRERLRVPPLTSNEAREAIVAPAALEGEWSSPRFTFEASCVAALIDFIDGVSERARVIEPLTLQLVCQRAESIAAARSTGGRPSELTLDDFGGVLGLERLVHDYFRSELEKLGDAATRRRALTLFEHGLLDPAGKRLMLEQDEIGRAYGLTQASLGMLVDSRLLRREPRNESIFYEISHDRLTEVIARNRAYRLPRWVKPAIAVTAIFIVGLMAALWVFNRERRDAIASRNAAVGSQRKTAEALQVLFGDHLADRLREAGLTDALQQVLSRAPADETDPRANALQSRRRGELAWERGTLAESERQFTKALTALDRAGLRDDPGVMAERALALRWLGDIHAERGQVTEARSRHTAAVELWKRVLASRNTPEFQLSAAEASVALGTILGRTGDWGGAEAAYLEGVRRALDVLWNAYDRVQDGTAAEGFDLGRALQVYADSTLSLARITWYPWELKGTRALAAELLRLRPTSAQARIQLGTASAIYGASVVADQPAPARRLFEESITQFRDVTQADPSNRRMLRERAAVLALTAETLGRCAIRAKCRDQLRPGELVAALTATLDAVSGFEQVAKGDDEDRAWLADKAWAFEIQALLARARRSFDTALQLVDQALDIRRRVVVDAADVEGRSAALNVLRTRAEVLGDSGKNAEALRTVEDVLREAAQLPEGPSRLSQRSEALRLQATLLAAAGRAGEAKSVAAEADRIGREIGSLSATRDALSRRLNQEGNAIFQRAQGLSGAEAGQEYDRASELYRQAAVSDPLSAVIWSNLRGSCSRAASARTADGTGQQPAEAAAPKEAALRCALTSAWMHWVLLGTVDDSDARARNAGLRTLYEARRSLAMFLSEASDKTATKRARALAEHGVQEAEAYFTREQSTDALFLRADASFGAARMRQESDAAGWEPAFRAAIAYGEQLRAREPSTAERHRWVGMARGELANRFDDAQRADDAAAERAVARRACQDALRLARTKEDRQGAEACLNAAAGGH